MSSVHIHTDVVTNIGARLVTGFGVKVRMFEGKHRVCSKKLVRYPSHNGVTPRGSFNTFITPT